jgi:phage RecT family recombinase
MSNDLALFEQQLRPMTPHFAEALDGSGLAPERLIRTLLVCLERTPRLLDCTRSSLLQAAMTAAVLGLEADGVTGQFHMIPFKDKAQPVIGYKGFNTLAGRSGLIINGAVVKEGDLIEYELGSDGFVRHRPLLGGGRQRRIIAAWATATRPGYTPIVQILDIDDLLFTKSKSPGARKGDSPWNDGGPVDGGIGFAAMCEKTAKRRLARGLPLNLMVRAAAMEEAHEEMGKHAYLDPKRGLVVEGVAQEIGDAQPGRTPSVASIEQPRFIIHKTRNDHVCDTIEDWRAKMMAAIEAITTATNLEDFRDRNEAEMDRLRDAHAEHVNAVGAAIEKRLRQL